MDLLIIGEAEDKLAQSIVDFFTALNKNVVILDVLSASQLFTLEIINGKVSVSPDLPMIIRTVSPSLIRKNFDDTFQYEEALSTLWAVATASQAPMLNRPTPHNMWGQIASSSVLTQVRADLIPDTQEIFTCHQKQSFSFVPEQQWYVQDLGTYESAVAGEVLSGSGPYRYRSTIAGADYEIVVVLANKAWRSTQVPLEHLNLEDRSISLLRKLNLNFGVVIWSIEPNLQKAAIARVESFPTWEQVELVWSELADSLYEVLCQKSM